MIKIDDEWTKVNKAWLNNRYKETLLLKKDLETCRAEKKR
jgi:hypothetical protein